MVYLSCCFYLELLPSSTAIRSLTFASLVLCSLCSLSKSLTLFSKLLSLGSKPARVFSTLPISVWLVLVVVYTFVNVNPMTRTSPAPNTPTTQVSILTWTASSCSLLEPSTILIYSYFSVNWFFYRRKKAERTFPLSHFYQKMSSYATKHHQSGAYVAPSGYWLATPMKLRDRYQIPCKSWHHCECEKANRIDASLQCFLNIIHIK